MNQLRFITVLSCGILFFAGYAPSLHADTAYVTSITQITLRTEPGVAHRIIEMLKSGTQLEIIERQRDWSMVRTPRGNKGWLLTRFVTLEKPKILLVDELERKNEVLTRELAVLKEENRTLSENSARLVEIEKKYHALKTESAQFFTLKQQFDQTQKQFNAQTEQIRTLEAGLGNDRTIFMIAGICVFILGLIFGVSTRKKKSNSLL